ncbi:NifU family protein [Sneathiella sp.]|uniref:NifU family protein n=1 Tax=Sneathiella sp. TaxID=1964365 RepID=UPI0035696BBD
MFIQTEIKANPARMNFLPGRTILATGLAHFPDAEAAERSPLARRLFEIDGVTGIYFDIESITVAKSNESSWDDLKPAILVGIMAHFTSGMPVMHDAEGDNTTQEDFILEQDTDLDLIDQIKDLIDTRIKPAATQQGSNIKFRGFKAGKVLLEFSGSAYSLLKGIENMLRHYIPEVQGVMDYREVLDKPGLDTPDGNAVQQILVDQINPQVAQHGGHIALVDVKEDTVYIRLEGGCQGCGMADVTLKQGIATTIMSQLPSIKNVLDVTDHADGTNPYYQPGKGGMSAI